MADTRAATGLTVQQWDDKFFIEYIQENRFAPLMGTDEMAILQVKEDLTKKQGDSVTFALVNKLTQNAITGTNTLEGNEEDMASRSFRLYVDKRRNAVRVAEMEEQRSAISLRQAARAVLKDWAMEDTIDLVVEALGSINGVNYASATEAQKDAYLLDNSDRVVFGAALSNTVAGDFSASLLNVDSTNDKLTGNSLRLLKRRAILANPKIRPMRDPGNGKRYYVAFANPLTFRDLQTDLQDELQHTVVESEASKLFEGGDLMWDGIIVKEIDTLPIYTGVGNGGINVSPVYLCGAQAVGVAYAKRWRSVTEEFDYGDKFGVAIDGIYGIKKMVFGSGNSDTADLKDHGVATGFYASVGD
jgi:N4-gp56 family major capsid protein